MEKQLPKNWVKVSLQDITKNVKGKKPKIQSEVEFEGSIAYMDIKALEYNVIRQFADIESSKLFEEGDVAMVWDGARSGWVSKTNFGAIGSTLVAFKPIKINSNYLFYYLLEKYPFINSNARGVGIPHVDPTVLWGLDFPLPPLAEQNRIVAKLDTLFTQLETIKTSMAKIPVLLKEFRQQVLTQAVTGKLTEEWRKGKELEEWKNLTLCDFADARLGKMLDNAKNSGELVNYLGNINVRWFEIDFSDLKRMKVESKEIHKYELLQGDILVCEGGEPGRAAIWKYDRKDIIFQKALHRIRLNKNVLPDYFLYNLRIDSVNNKLSHFFTGTTIKHLTGKSFSNYDILVPPLEEQQEIVSRVESLFAKADTIEQQYLSVKEKIDNLPQALLHKAFKGELTEQLESDGDARELLQQIQELKNSTVKPKKATSKKVKKYPENETVLGMVAEPKEELSSKVIKLKPTNSEIYKRTLLAAEIVYQLKDTNTLGHLKLQKMLYLCQEIGSMNLPMNFLKQAMGPYDNQLARSLDKQFVVKKWFEYQNGALLKYKPLENCGNHKEDFQKYFETEVEQINYLINKFKKFTSNQIEAVATLYACWKEAIEQKELITDKLIINKFYQWSKEKEKFREENMIKALDWMRKNGVEPKRN